MKDHSRTARRLTNLLLLAQSLGSAGFIASSTVSSIVGAELSGVIALGGVPGAIYQAWTALGAYVWGLSMDRLGRRGGLALGLMVGVVGAEVAAGAIVVRSFPLFLVGIALMGVANAALQLGRFAAAEIHPPAERGRAISRVVIGGTAGALLGPLMVGPMGELAQRVGVDELAGAYTVGFVLFAVAALMIFLRLRPDPRDLGREMALLHPAATIRSGAARSIPGILRQPPVRVAIVAMVSGQMVMTMLMSITALHMKVEHQPLTGISMVVSSHFLGMYAFSILSGRMTDRWGREPTILVGAVLLVLSSLLAPLSPEVVPMGVAMFLVGLGWNLCYVGGSSLLADQLSPAERARTQGFNDLLVWSAGAGGSAGSGVAYATVGYGLMGALGVVASLVPLALTIRWQMVGRRMATAR